MWKVAGIEMLRSTGISLGLVLGLAGLGLPSLPISSETLPALWIGDVDSKTLSLRRKLGRAGVMSSTYAPYPAQHFAYRLELPESKGDQMQAQ